MQNSLKIIVVLISFSLNLFSEMVLVEGGNFTMDCLYIESEIAQIDTFKIQDFYISKYEVTQREWKSIMGFNPSQFIGDQKPVERISWFDAISFCNKKSALEGLDTCYILIEDSIFCDVEKSGYRLPLESEWQYAARGGQLAKKLQVTPDSIAKKAEKWFKFSGSDNIDEVAWYKGNSYGTTHKIGTKNPNQLGLYDMSGNVWEWCDVSAENLEVKQSLFQEEIKVSRGGCWDDYFWNCLYNSGRINYQGESIKNIGLRLARTFVD